MEFYASFALFIPVSGWFKINTEEVCFGDKDDSYGNFSIRKTGKIFAFKLVHRSGSVSCVNKPNTGTKWGCSEFGSSFLCTLITNTSNVRLVSLPSNGFGCYQLPGFHYNSDEIELRPSSPVGAHAGQEFRIWYSEDLLNNYDFDNYESESCVDVYGFY